MKLSYTKLDYIFKRFLIFAYFVKYWVLKPLWAPNRYLNVTIFEENKREIFLR